MKNEEKEKFIAIINSMCDLWLKTHGLRGKEHVDFVLSYINKEGDA